MNIKEMSNEFDIFYNQVNSNQAPGIDEYEKSVFLTKAQDEIVKAYFDPRGNKFLEGFDDGRKRQYDFSLLVVNTTLTPILASSVTQYDPRSHVYIMPSDLFLTLNESVVETVDSTTYIYQVLPISYTQYGILMQKPYQYPTKRTVWRLITGQTESASTISSTTDFAESTKTDTSSVVDTSVTILKGQYTYCEVIGRFKDDYDEGEDPEYRMRYVKKPTPIILVNLDTEYEGLTIDGYHGNADDESIAVDDDDTGSGIPCYLPEGVHHEIVQRAVELATAIYNPQALSNIVGVGNVSATNLGVVQSQGGKQ